MMAQTQAINEMKAAADNWANGLETIGEFYARLISAIMAKPLTLETENDMAMEWLAITIYNGKSSL